MSTIGKRYFMGFIFVTEDVDEYQRFPNYDKFVQTFKRGKYWIVPQDKTKPRGNYLIAGSKETGITEAVSVNPIFLRSWWDRNKDKIKLLEYEHIYLG
jgi:hypothetical protein